MAHIEATYSALTLRTLKLGPLKQQKNLIVTIHKNLGILSYLVMDEKVLMQEFTE